MSEDGEEGGRSEEASINRKVGNKGRWKTMGREKGRTEVKAEDEEKVGNR